MYGTAAAASSAFHHFGRQLSSCHDGKLQNAFAAIVDGDCIAISHLFSGFEMAHLGRMCKHDGSPHVATGTVYTFRLSRNCFHASDAPLRWKFEEDCEIPWSTFRSLIMAGILVLFCYTVWIFSS